ncbi:hypothetical protein D3C71_1660950 [compost metagenome]
MSNKYRFIVCFCDCCFMRCTEIITPSNIFKAFIVQELDRIVISNAWEWCFDILQLGNIATYRFQLRTAILQYRLHYEANKFFLNLQAFFVICKGHFWLDHPELN